LILIDFNKSIESKSGPISWGCIDRKLHKPDVYVGVDEAAAALAEEIAEWADVQV